MPQILHKLTDVCVNEFTSRSLLPRPPSTLDISILSPSLPPAKFVAVVAQKSCTDWLIA